MLTVFLLTIVVYIYTVVAFNFFRKFYVFEEEGEEADQKCHDMFTVRFHTIMKENLDFELFNFIRLKIVTRFSLFTFQCFVFHLYKGVRAGGGVGDELEPPDGDPLEAYRILFDISFFFFIVVILLAIIQGGDLSLIFMMHFKALSPNGLDFN